MPDRRIRPGARRVARAAVCVAVALAAQGCASWKATDLTPQQVFAGEHPSKIRVTTDDGAQLVLARPRVLGNVVAGFEDECLRAHGNGSSECEEVGVPVFEISLFEVYRRGAAAYVLPAVAGLSLAWLLANR